MLHGTPAPTPSAQDLRRAGAVGAWLLLLAALIYVLTYSGVIHAVDEQSALSVAESVLLGQGVHVNQMAWDQARTPPQNSAGLDGNLYSKKGIGVSLVALPLLAVGKLTGAVGAVQLALLTGAVLAALAAWAFYRLILALGYGLGVAVLGTLLFAFATPMWPYARTLFSETPATCGLAFGLWGIVAWRRNPRHPLRTLVLSGLGLALLVLAKSSNAVVLPAFGGYLLYGLWSTERALATGEQTGRWRRWGGPLLAFGLPVALAIAATVGYNYVRFGTTFSFPLEPFEQFNTPLVVGLAGLLFSPGKGIFWYMPLLWLAPFFVGHWRRGGRLPDYLLALGAALPIIVVYALWYDWPGGRAWGPRMIITAVPALAMLTLPAVDWLLTRKRVSIGAIAVAAVMVVSFLVQLPGVFVNFERQEMLDMQAGASFDQLLWQPALSPLLTYWQRLASTPDVLWLQPYFATLPAWLWLVLVLVSALAIAGLVTTAVRLRRGRTATGLPAVTAAAVLTLAGLLVYAALPDPRWDERSAVREDNAALLAMLQAEHHPGNPRGDVVLLDMTEKTDQGGRTGLWLNRGGLQPYIGWRREFDLAGTAGERLQRWLAPYRRAWLVLQETADGDPGSTTEQWLNGWAYPGRRAWLGAQRYVEYFLPDVAAPLPATPNATGPVTFGEAAVLDHYTLQRVSGTDDVLLDLRWQARPADNIRFSVQQLDAAGSVVAQVDGRPGELPGQRPGNRVGLAGVTNPGPLILKVYAADTGAVYAPDGDGADYLSLR